MPNILKLDKIAKLAEQVFPASYKLDTACENPVGILVRSFKMHDYAMPESVLCVARAGAGVDNIPLAAYAEKGIVVFNTPGANANAVKELVICAMFLSARKVVAGINWMQTLKGQDELKKKMEAGKKDFAGTEILGKTVGVIGLGAIGSLVAEACAALGMKVIVYTRTAEKVAALKNPNITSEADLDKLLPKCDYITLHVPSTEQTKGMINKDTLAKCKNGVNIINAARNDLCKNADIVEAINSGKINRYVTDFPEDNVLLGVDNVVTIPHLGASSAEAEDNCALMAAEQTLDFIENGNIVNSVNFPAVKLDRCCKNSRVTVAFKGALNIKEAAEKAGVKVCGYNEGKKGDFGYAIVDCDKPADAAKAIEKLAGVLKVRQL